MANLLGVIFLTDSKIDRRSYRKGEYAEFLEEFSLTLCVAGTARRADGRPVERRMVDSKGHTIRATIGTPPLNAAKAKAFKIKK